MKPIASVEELQTHYKAAAPLSLSKVADRITPLYREWIEASRFLVLSSIGPDGTDGSPRGDSGPVVTIKDPHTILLPDWQGNNRLDSLRNIVADGRVSLMFMIQDCENVVRVNGRAIVTADDALRARFDRDGKQPATVIVVTVAEIYVQCAKAIMRARLWSGKDAEIALPTAGDFLAEAKAGFDGAAYDSGYPDHAKTRMW